MLGAYVPVFLFLLILIQYVGSRIIRDQKLVDLVLAIFALVI